MTSGSQRWHAKRDPLADQPAARMSADVRSVDRHDPCRTESTLRHVPKVPSSSPSRHPWNLLNVQQSITSTNVDLQRSPYSKIWSFPAFVLTPQPPPYTLIIRFPPDTVIPLHWPSAPRPRLRAVTHFNPILARTLTSDNLCNHIKGDHFRNRVTAGILVLNLLRLSNSSSSVCIGMVIS